MSYKYRIILASGSPRRRELMDRIGASYEIIPSTKEEIMADLPPADLVMGLSRMKAWDVAEKLGWSMKAMPSLTADQSEAASGGEDGDAEASAEMDTRSEAMSGGKDAEELDAAVIIGADTVVSLNGRILGKPKDIEDAYQMLKCLQAAAHAVYTGVSIIVRRFDGTISQECFSIATRVHIAAMTEKEIREYIATGEPMDKAGAYAIQGEFAPYVERIEGDYYNIVGFPLASIYKRFKELKINLRTGESLV